jgi:hypothetical protein
LVGSLIILGGKIIVEGIEAVRLKFDPTAPAEIEALRAIKHARFIGRCRSGALHERRAVRDVQFCHQADGNSTSRLGHLE